MGNLAYMYAELPTGNRDAKIVYSPLHGTGIKTVVPVLMEAGFEDVHVVAEQAKLGLDSRCSP